jgi:hypothetical protein
LNRSRSTLLWLGGTALVLLMMGVLLVSRTPDLRTSVDHSDDGEAIASSKSGPVMETNGETAVETVTSSPATEPSRTDADGDQATIVQATAPLVEAVDPELQATLRRETRRLVPALQEVGRNWGATNPGKLHFPLFDGESVPLQVISFSPGRRDGVGVILARLNDDPLSHVVLSYADDAVEGLIHLPTRNEYFEVSYAGGDRTRLAQLDPAHAGGCGMEHAPTFSP